MCTSPTRDTRTCTSKRCTKTSKTHCNNKKTHQIHSGRLQRSAWTLNGDSERDHIGERAHNGDNQTNEDEAMVDDPEPCGTQYNIQKIRKQYITRSPSGKEKQPDYVEIDRRNRRYWIDAEANDMIHLESDQKSVTAHFRFPRANTKGGFEAPSKPPCPSKKLRSPPPFNPSMGLRGCLPGEAVSWGGGCLLGEAVSRGGGGAVSRRGLSPGGRGGGEEGLLSKGRSKVRRERAFEWRIFAWLH